MLETVKRFIHDLDDLDFSEYFANYVARVQDRNIDAEIETLRRQNNLNIYVMDRLMEKSVEEYIHDIKCGTAISVQQTL